MSVTLPITLTLPWPPSVNYYWRHIPCGRQIRTILTREARKYKNDVEAIVMAKNAAAGLSEPLAVELVLFPPDNKTRDIDNYSKGLFDALTEAGVWEDDSLVKELHTYMKPSAGRLGSARIVIRNRTAQ